MEFPSEPIAAAIVALAWIPVFLRFFRSWRTRGNPISMAICVLVVYALYVPIFMTASLPPSWPPVTVIAVDAIVCMTFYGTFHFADRKFPDDRRESPRKPN